MLYNTGVILVPLEPFSGALFIRASDRDAVTGSSLEGILMMSRYAVFIDGGYVRKVLEQFGKPRISYLRLSQEVARGEDRLRTYYYDCPPFTTNVPSEEEKTRQSRFDRFCKMLEREPRFQVRLGRLQRISEGKTFRYEQKKVDILVTCDLLRLSLEKQITRAVLFAGDSDFVPAIQIARDAGTIVELYYSDNPRPHDELLSACDERIVIREDFIERIAHSA